MNEVRVIDKLCKNKHENIVMVMRHGWLNSSFYFFDMELCNMNLEEWIRSTGKKRGLTGVGGYDVDVFNIMKQITSGIGFIHSHMEVHRDLKPRNGSVADEVRVLMCSIISRRRSQMENSRLWSIRGGDV